MFLGVLRRDLKRKKTMNVILLLFIILATMFVSASMNNVLTMTSALDNYFNKANMSDFVAVSKTAGSSREEISGVLDDVAAIESFGTEELLYLNEDQMRIGDGKAFTMDGIVALFARDDSYLQYFDDQDQLIGEVKPGEIFLNANSMADNQLAVGDTITFAVGDTKEKLRIAGTYRDVLFGSNWGGITRILMSGEDFRALREDPYAVSSGGAISYICTKDNSAVENALNDLPSTTMNIVFMGGRQMISMLYVMDLIISAILLVMSVCLILISFVVLRFTIAFTLTEEFREIGVMKAIGIPATRIRGLYLVKYLSMAIIGSTIGFFLGIPFGAKLLETAERSIPMSGMGAYWINLISVFIVVGIIMLFCFGCTGRVNRMTPIDAIREGSNGERFGRKGLLKLHRLRIRPVLFLAQNDVLTDVKRYLIMAAAFLLCLLLVVSMVNAVNSLNSEKLMRSFSMTTSDVYIDETSFAMRLLGSKDGKEKDQRIEDLEKLLADNGMPAEIHLEVNYKMSIKHGDASCKSIVMQGTGTNPNQYAYTSGTPPQNTKEVAMTEVIARKLGVVIGDTVTLSFSDGDRDFLVTALYQSMRNLGEGVRLHQDVKADFLQAAKVFAFQADFTDQPNADEITMRREKIAGLLPEADIYDGVDYVNIMTGNVAGSLEGVRTITIVLALMICILIAVLMERSFITRETGEIALMKATGFSDDALIIWHTLRTVIVLAAAAVISVFVSTPFTDISTGQGFRLMGATAGIEYAINAPEVYVLYPLLMIIAAAAATFLTAQSIRQISATECSAIE
jgi:putative ABC transport system permease protein